MFGRILHTHYTVEKYSFSSFFLHLKLSMTPSHRNYLVHVGLIFAPYSTTNKHTYPKYMYVVTYYNITDF